MSTRSVVGCGLVSAFFLLAAPAWADQPSDAWITTKVKIALLSAETVDGLDINVDTVDGRVTLHGKVDSENEKKSAESLARDVDGVREVKDLLAVVPDEAEEQVERSDEELQQQINTVLERDAGLEDSNIDVASVNDGVVVLTGQAETLSAHRRALEDVRAIDGVRRVSSQIKSPDQLGDEEIWADETADSEAESTNNAASDMWITTKTKLGLISEPGLSPFAINVDTRAGVVTLFGIVNSEELKQRAAAEAKEIKGVKAVENELQVVPDVAADKTEESDDAVLAAVKERLSEATELQGSDIDIAVKNSVVRLTGTVESQQDRLRALTLARGASGVSSVIDDLQLSTPKS